MCRPLDIGAKLGFVDNRVIYFNCQAAGSAAETAFRVAALKYKTWRVCAAGRMPLMEPEASGRRPLHLLYMVFMLPSH